MKQDIREVPLFLVQEAVQKEFARVEEDLMAEERLNYEALLRRKEKEWNDTHEAPYEGNFEDLYPFTPPNPEYLQSKRAKVRAEVVKSVVESLGLKTKASWFLPQATAYVASMKLPRGENGLIDPKAYRQQNFGKDDWHKGLFYVLTSHQRGNIVPTQTKPDFKNYSALVPLLMMPHKKFNNIMYSEWDRVGIRSIVEDNLADAMLCNISIDLGSEELLELRERGLTVGSGEKSGTIRNAATYHNLYRMEGTALAELPWLAKVMITQIWAAHPVNRTPYMILDWKDWDNMPDPLIEKEIVKPLKECASTTPWDDWI